MQVSTSAGHSLERAPAGAIRSHISLVVLFGVLLVTPLLRGQAGKSKDATGQPSSPTPSFSDKDGLAILDNLQAALESYNGKHFLAEFDARAMANFPEFREQINALFERYDSFTVSYHLLQTAMEKDRGIVLADFGLDGTSNADATPDLRRHTQLRLVVECSGKQWKIVDLSPRAVFSGQ